MKENTNTAEQQKYSTDKAIPFDALVGLPYLTGNDLVGHIVEVWQESKKWGRFRSVGKVIKYRKSKNKKLTANYLVQFKGTKSQGEYFNLWMSRSWMKQLD